MRVQGTRPARKETLLSRQDGITQGVTHCSTDRYLATINSANESHDVDEDTSYIASVCAPVDSEGKIVRARAARVIQFFNPKIPATHKVVVADHDASDGA